jgi:rSAM/selenodomain-associated transferase 2
MVDKPYSVIIPVLNEAEIINSLLDDLMALERSEACELIVVDGGADDDTIKAIKRQGIYGIQSPKGRANQMNAGAALARGKILIFLHADTRLPRQALNLIDQAMAGKDFVGGAFDLRIDSERIIYRMISRISSWRSRLTRIPYGDQAIFIRRDYFNEVGRYPGIPLMEEVSFMQKIKKAGGRICFISTPVITSARRWEQEGILYTTLRNWLILSAYLMGASPYKLSKYYRSP